MTSLPAGSTNSGSTDRNSTSGDTGGTTPAPTNVYSPSALISGVSLSEQKIGDNSLRIISPAVIEPTYINTKALTNASVAS